MKDGVEGKFAFVNFGIDGDREHGIIAASKAVESFHEKEFHGAKLYVQSFTPKAYREIEFKKDILRYKNSKKRCNLHIKNLNPETTAQ